MKTSSAKQKGRKLQQWVRDEILKRFPTMRAEDVRSTSMGAGGEDVQLSPFARDLLPIQVECKSHKDFAVYRILDQAAEHGNYQPVVFLKANNRSPIAVVDAELWLDMAGKYYGNS